MQPPHRAAFERNLPIITPPLLQDDLEIAVDFFDYFTATEPLLDEDDTLLAVRYVCEVAALIPAHSFAHAPPDLPRFLCSAWNDLGQTEYVSDPAMVYRTDFFPGLGWMTSRHVRAHGGWRGARVSCASARACPADAQRWEEIGPKWPNGFWDDWLREPPQRKGRNFLRPEISRTYTFGEQVRGDPSQRAPVTHTHTPHTYALHSFTSHRA